MDNPTVLAADLYDLLTVADRNFATVASEYRTSAGAVDSTSGMEGALRRPEHFGGGPQGAAMTAWAHLRDTFANTLKETQTSLDQTAEALRLCVRVYCDANTAAKNELAEAIAAKGRPTALPEVTR